MQTHAGQNGSRGRTDLHVHYLPAVDDGVRTVEEGVALLRGLYRLGYRRAVATPHMRTVMFPNTRRGLTAAFETFREELEREHDVPAVDLASEHHFDDVFWSRLQEGRVLPYPGGRAILIELPDRRFPVGIERAVFSMAARRLTPVIAHPERYRPCFRKSDALDALLRGGALAQLDLMSLVGRYGKRPQQAAERLLDERAYHIASTDCHRPEDVEIVARAIERLEARVGAEETRALLEERPHALLQAPSLPNSPGPP